MNLTEGSFELAKKIREESLKMNIIDFENYVTKEINDYIATFDMTIMDKRYELHSFLSHLRVLYLNIMVNGELYFFGIREYDLAKLGITIINNISQTIINTNNEKPTYW